MTYRARKYFYRIFKILLWIILSLILLYNFTNFRPSQHKNTATFQNNSTGIVSSQGKTKELLFIAVLTHWSRWKRRASIRETWMTQCTRDARAKCLFFTDDAGAKDNDKHWLDSEVSTNNDTILMPMSGIFCNVLLILVKFTLALMRI